MYLLYPFTSILHLFGVTENGSSHSSLFFKSLFHVFFYFYFFNLRLCLWFDLHRHLFLLVLFLLCGCDFNQEMEMQKSTCCHSKYVRFHPQIYRSPRPSPCSSRVCLFVCLCLHGCTQGDVLCCELTLNSFKGLSLNLFPDRGGLLQLPFPFFSWLSFISEVKIGSLMTMAWTWQTDGGCCWSKPWNLLNLSH